MRGAVLVLTALFCAAPSLADAPKPQPLPAARLPAEAPVQKFGVTHPECREWTDGCVVCVRENCSTPGIACTPHEPVCNESAK